MMQYCTKYYIKQEVMSGKHLYISDYGFFYAECFDLLTLYNQHSIFIIEIAKDMSKM